MTTHDQIASGATATLPSAAGWLGGEDGPESRIDRLLFHGSLDGRGVLDLIVAAVLADRSERPGGLVAAVADVLEDRGSRATAARVREADEDELWSVHLGPMIDSIERRFTRP